MKIITPDKLYLRTRCADRDGTQHVLLDTKEENKLGLVFGDKVTIASRSTTQATYLGIGPARSFEPGNLVLWFKVDDQNGASYWDTITANCLPKNEKVTIINQAMGNTDTNIYSDPDLAYFLGTAAVDTIQCFELGFEVQKAAIEWLNNIIKEVNDLNNDTTNKYKLFLNTIENEEHLMLDLISLSTKLGVSDLTNADLENISKELGMHLQRILSSDSNKYLKLIPKIIKLAYDTYAISSQNLNVFVNIFNFIDPTFTKGHTDTIKFNSDEAKMQLGNLIELACEVLYRFELKSEPSFIFIKALRNFINQFSDEMIKKFYEITKSKMASVKDKKDGFTNPSVNGYLTIAQILQQRLAAAETKVTTPNNDFFGLKIPEQDLPKENLPPYDGAFTHKYYKL